MYHKANDIYYSLFDTGANFVINCIRVDIYVKLFYKWHDRFRIIYFHNVKTKA